MEWLIGGGVLLAAYVGVACLIGRCMSTPDDDEIAAELARDQLDRDTAQLHLEDREMLRLANLRG